MFYDDKSRGVVTVGKILIIDKVNESEDVVFKASFSVANSLVCDGKVTALFDLFVLGDIKCEELDVKGRLVCLGDCYVNESIIVQNEMWVNDLKASQIVCHDIIVALGVDADEIVADGTIMVGKTLAVEEKVKTFHNILCGETAYGAGKIIANTVVTAEPLDMDDGEEVIESPYVFKSSNTTTTLLDGLDKYINSNDYVSYIESLEQIYLDVDKKMFKRAKKVFKAMDNAYPDNISEFTDLSLLLWLMEMVKSKYFVKWQDINKWLSVMINHFDNIVHGKETINSSPRPADILQEGYIVSHVKYGYGEVTNVYCENHTLYKRMYATIVFEEYGEKKFPIPDALKFFRIISEKKGMSSEEIRASLVCDIDGYDEWLIALLLLNNNKTMIGEKLYQTIYDKLLAQMGLKAKYIEDRLHEKGWT